ncbi:peroxiredoxin family protein [Aestuariimicrobium sp. T2.26MG-19.2B]|uniref:peroxiredoxin family protein n=1 Tax=Aestuariimicrobium sp. T2.26MG-19.2B TaxID=3040679 RepID=UPI0024779DC7|nr:peroxiredoxin family protein [Aestuariimicrobium sp. T2.26MG-19.2B]CAI9411508.1 Thiol-disulfide oxidoreductase ResA [Aestuariimicrobium sp. T2.26MG-19.2B]
MATRHHPTVTGATARQQLQQQLIREKARDVIRRRVIGFLGGALVVAVAALVAFGLWSARSTDSNVSRQAPAFSLTTTAGTTVSLSDYRGKPVILYFNEGAGCGSCTQQMAAIEKDPGFTRSGITVLPIVMNTAEQIEPDLATFGVKTPYLLDDGTVSKAYDTLGKGMHEGLPGHGFVLIDADGNQRWQGDYPSMWIAPGDLLKEVTGRLS